MTASKNEVVENQGLVRVNPRLLPLIDIVVAEAKDNLGLPRFKSRKQVVDAALANYLPLYLPKTQVTESKRNVKSNV